LAISTDPTQAAEMAWSLASILHMAGRYADSLPVIEDGLRRADLPPVWQPRLRAARARTLAALGRTRDAEVEASEAAADGERLGDRVSVGYAEQVLYLVSNFSTGLGHAERALATIGHAPETIPLRVMLLTNRAYGLEQLGDIGGEEAA